jgi:hypothetical protein
MSYLIVDGMGDNRADTRSRVADCSGFFSLDEFDARPVDTRAFAAGIELKECSTFASFRCAPVSLTGLHLICHSHQIGHRSRSPTDVGMSPWAGDECGVRCETDWIR